jgi:hypothetical protein
MKNLTPLTPEQEEEFSRHRISAAVVQNKCPNCGAWYETRRLATMFVETFDCDCGARLSYAVPAAETAPLITKPSTEEILMTQDGTQKLDTGMTVQEAVRRAAAWWQTKGRRLAKTELKRQKLGSHRGGNSGVFASLDPDDANFMPSGLIHGKPWEELTRRECLMVVKAWHHFAIRMPDLLDLDNATPHKMQDRGTIH